MESRSEIQRYKREDEKEELYNEEKSISCYVGRGYGLGAQTGVWAASDTSDQKEGELTLLLTNSWIDGVRSEQ